MGLLPEIFDTPITLPDGGVADGRSKDFVFGHSTRERLKHIAGPTQYAAEATSLTGGEPAAEDEDDAETLASRREINHTIAHKVKGHKDVLPGQLDRGISPLPQQIEQQKSAGTLKSGVRLAAEALEQHSQARNKAALGKPMLAIGTGTLRKWKHGEQMPDDLAHEQKFMVKNAADEVQYADRLAEERNKVYQDSIPGSDEFYTTQQQQALLTLGTHFPTLMETAHPHRGIFTAIQAITSNGETGKQNFAHSANVFRNFIEDGEDHLAYPVDAARGEQMTAALSRIDRIYQDLRAKHGSNHEAQQALNGELLKELTYGQLKQLAAKEGYKFPEDTYQDHVKLPLAALVMGPKLGAYYGNLMGSHGYLTMDRWDSRFFNRLRGRLAVHPTQKTLDKARDLVNSLGGKYKVKQGDDAKLKDHLYDLAKKYEGNAPRDAAGKKVGNFWTDLELKVGTKRTRFNEREFDKEAKSILPPRVYARLEKLHTVEKHANHVHGLLHNDIRDAPTTAKERSFRIDTAEKIAAELKARDPQRYAKMSLSGLQAKIWFLEKEIYGHLGSERRGLGVSTPNTDALHVLKNYARHGGYYVTPDAERVSGFGGTADARDGGEPTPFGRDVESVSRFEAEPLPPIGIDLNPRAADPKSHSHAVHEGGGEVSSPGRVEHDESPPDHINTGTPSGVAVSPDNAQLQQSSPATQGPIFGRDLTANLHAPAEGVDVAGEHFVGGQLIPESAVAHDWEAGTLAPVLEAQVRRVEQDHTMRDVTDGEEDALSDTEDHPYGSPEAATEAANSARRDFMAANNHGTGVERALSAKALDMNVSDYSHLQSALEAPGSVVVNSAIVPALAASKANWLYSGDWRRVRDLVSGTVAVDTLDEIPTAMQVIRDEYGKRGWTHAGRPVNRMLYPPLSGYREVTLNLKHPVTGLNCELNVTTKPMLKTSQMIDGRIYGEAKEITKGAIEQRRSLTPEESSNLAEVLELSRTMYDEDYGVPRKPEQHAAIPGSPVPMIYKQSDGVIMRAPADAPYWPCEMYVGNGRWTSSFDAFWLYFSRGFPASGEEVVQLMDVADRSSLKNS